MTKFFSNIHSLAYAVPKQSLTNHELERIVCTTDQWITERTGIKSRFIAQPHETALSLALEAAKKTLAQSNLSPKDIDGVIVGTSSSDYVFPSMACLIAGELGIPGFGFDVQAACSGFVYVQHIANQFLTTGQYQHLLVLGVDTLSKVLDWNDRKTCVLFGDGAGAAIFSRSTSPGILTSFIGALADREESLVLKNSWTHEGTYKIQMDGPKVFKQAVLGLSSCVDHLLKEAHLSAEDIDLVVPHQANARILEAVAARSSIPASKYFQCLDQYGNTSAASIPIALTEALQQQRITSGTKVMTIAFGAGLTYGGSIIQWT